MWRNPQKSLMLCPESPRAKFRRHFCKRLAKNAAKFWQFLSLIFILQFPGKRTARTITKTPRHIPHCTKTVFNCFNSWSWGAQMMFKTFFLVLLVAVLLQRSPSCKPVPSRRTLVVMNLSVEALKFVIGCIAQCFLWI